jgi:CRP/FNR family transcriptional regulator, dissimilatory nitrate respiration regulator
MIVIMFEQLRDLRRIERSFEEGQHLFHLGDHVKFLFLIEAGSANLVRHHQNGGVVVLQRAMAGSILAEASLFTARYHCDAVATAPVVARLISKPALQQLFFSNQDFAKAWAAHLAREVRNARLRAEILSLRTVAERLDAWLADRGELPERGSWKAISEEIGTSAEALYREIARRRKT